jgi:hypothetical protein
MLVLKVLNCINAWSQSPPCSNNNTSYQLSFSQNVRKSECGDAKEDEMLEWVPAGLNTGALSSAKASSSHICNRLPGA